MCRDASYTPNEFDTRVDRFDVLWQSGTAPAIEDFLPPQDSPILNRDERQRLLVELVMIDLEFRWRRHAGNCPASSQSQSESQAASYGALPAQPRLEEYLQGYPELGEPDQLPVELIANEYRVRQRWGDRPSHAEYVKRRFSSHRHELEAALRAVDEQLPSAHACGGLHVRCPHCRRTIELVHDASVTDVTCSSCGSNFNLLHDETDESGDGKTIGHFELLQKLGHGAFGTVWKARDTQLDRVVAFKIPRRGQLDDTQAEQFLREARAVAQLNHPNIVGVHEVGRDGTTVFIISDLVWGDSLSEWMTAQQPSFRQAAELCATIAEALYHAHQAGVIHRDLKPQNIIVDVDGRPYLTDFGAARREAGEVTMTVDGQLLGTPAYMSPEQAQGHSHQADGRTDIYSLGVILFEILTGEMPFRGSVHRLMQQVIHDDAPHPRKLNSHVPRDLETVCLKCLEKAPRNRYPSAQDLADELHRFLEGQPIQARPITPPARAWRWCRRYPLAAAMVLLILFLAVAGPLIALNQSRLAKREAAARTREFSAREDLRRQLYIADMNLALHAWDASNVRRVLRLLAQHRPSAGQEDPRQFEWYYLWRLCQGGLMSLNHEAPIRGAAISPDGTKLVTGGWDGSIKVGSLSEGNLLGTLNGHKGIVYSISFSPDGTTFASGGVGGRLLFWQVEPLRQVDMRRIDAGAVRAVEFSPDGRRLATGHDNGIIILWDVSSRQPIGRKNAHTGWIWNVRFSPDGTTLASAGNDHVVKLWNVDTGEIELRKELKKHTARVYSVAFSPDGKTLASGSVDNHVIFWNIPTGDIQKTLTGYQGGVICVTFSADGSMLASSCQAGFAIVWDLARDEEKVTLKGHSANVINVAFSPTSDTVVTTSYDGTAKVWDVSTERVRNTLRGHRKTVGALAFAPSGETLVSGSEDGTLRIWDVETGKQRSILQGTTAKVSSVAYCPNGKTLASGDFQGAVALWDLTTRNEQMRLEKHAASVLDVAFSPSGDMVASCGKDDRVKLWDAQTGRDRHTFSALTSSTFAGSLGYGAVAFSPSGRVLAIAGAEGNVQLRDVNTGEELGTLQGHSAGILSVSFSPDGGLLAAGSDDMTAIVWNVSSRRVQQRLEGHTGGVFSVKFFPNPNNETLVSGSYDGRVILWDLGTGKERFSFRHGPVVRSVAVSPTGQALASAGDDRTVKLWRAATQDEVQAAGEWWNR